MYLIVGVGLHNGIHFIGNLVLWLFYHNEFSFVERYKCNDQPWPWYEDNAAWRTLCFKSIALLIFNSNVLVYLVTIFGDYTGLMEYHDTSIEKLPDTETLMKSIAFFMLVEDFIFYWCHRFLHWKVIYPHIHKIHHQHSVTVGVASLYAHPVEFIFGNMMPTIIGPAILGPQCHIATVWAWYIIRFGENIDGHSGYEFSWSPYRLIPFSSSAEYHDFHHSANVGNYGSLFSIWDTVFGTNEVFYEE